MFATVSTWRLSEPLREDNAYRAFVKQVLEQNVEVAREIGLIDVMVIRTGIDTVTSIGIYEDEDAAQAALERTTKLRSETYASSVELLDRKMGYANDIPQLTGRWD